MMLQGEGSPAAGAGMLLVLGYAIYWVVRSRRRIRTVLYALASVVAEILVSVVFRSDRNACSFFGIYRNGNYGCGTCSLHDTAR